jgi:hypothetical protein
VESLGWPKCHELEERAAIQEYDGGLSKEEAEQEAVYQFYSQLELFM